MIKRPAAQTGFPRWTFWFLCGGVFFLILAFPSAAAASSPASPQTESRFVLWQQKITQLLNRWHLAAGEHTSVSQNNLFNSNIRITGGASFSGGRQTIRVGVVKENLFGTPLFLGVEQSGRWEQDRRYHLKGEGQDLYVGMMVTKKTKATLKYQYRHISLYHLSDFAPPIFYADQGNHQVGDLELLLERSTLNARFYPTKGSDYRLEGAYAASGLGSDYNFTRMEGQARFYVTPGKFFTYVFRTKAGAVSDFGTKTDEVPFFERYFLGGASTIRAYRSRQAGPKDGNNLPLGGNLLWVNNFEVRFPIHKKLNGAVFLDTGGLWSHANKFSFGSLKYGTGVGLRYLTPWGVLRVDYGVRLSHEADEPRTSLHATFGVPF